MTYEIVNPEDLGGRPRGWNNGMLAPAGGRVLFVAGQTARDASGAVPALTFADQWGPCLANVLRVVRAAGGTPADIGRMTIYVTDIAAYRANQKAIGAIYRRHMGKHYPAMALVEVSALVDHNAMIEIEATAILDSGEG